MIEQGMVLLVQGNAGVAAVASAGGGFLGSLPKDFPLPSWSYIVASDPVDYELGGSVNVSNTRIQIDCYGASAVDALALAAAIDAVLQGYHGTMTDPDSTVVQGCFRSNKIDFFDDEARNYRRMLEYQFRANIN